MSPFFDHDINDDVFGTSSKWTLTIASFIVERRLGRWLTTQFREFALIFIYFSEKSCLFSFVFLSALKTTQISTNRLALGID